MHCNKYECEAAEEEVSHMLKLRVSADSGQFLYNTIEFRYGLRHRFIVDTGSCKSIIPKNVIEAIQSIVPINSAVVHIHGVSGHRLTLLGECISIRFLISNGSPFVLGLSALHALGHSVLP